MKKNRKILNLIFLLVRLIDLEEKVIEIMISTPHWQLCPTVLFIKKWFVEKLFFTNFLQIKLNRLIFIF